MRDLSRPLVELPPEQQAIRAKCFHPTGTFVEFRKKEVEQSIPERFEKIARTYPDRLAIETKEHALTYDSLNKAADRVARAILNTRGGQIEPIILLSGDALNTFILCLGTLKAGKTQVTIDPSFPPERIAYMLDDSQARSILTDSKNLSLATDLAKGERQVISIDALDGNPSGENIGLRVSPDAPAQIVYTSGSTGQPKGIVRSHRMILHSTMLLTSAVHISPDDRLLILSSLSLGNGIFELLRGLLNGAALFPFDIKKEGLSNLDDFLVQHRITYYTSTPSTFRYFVNQLSGKDKFPDVRVIQLAGEPLAAREVELYKMHFSENCILINRLGSSEAGNICQYFIDRETEITGPIVPSGYPVEDKEVFLLDEYGNEVGVNQVGEIAVRSRYLSTEYWREPDLTSAKFLNDPDGGDKRLYLTGDLGRRLPDGCLVYLGRKDLEVKIRGYKVAISETEIALREYVDVKEAAVKAWDSDSGEKYLVAYLVSPAKLEQRTSQIHEFLKTRLPDYMIPSAFVMLDAMPLTPNGKVDRKALPEPGKSRPQLNTPFVAPRTPVEAELTRIWSEVLSLDQVGVYDNFFDLGGHSLAATRVLSRVMKNFQLELPLQSLFQAPTVAAMSAVITEHQGKKLSEQELNRVLTELESLTNEEAERLLSQDETRHKEQVR